jgi:hypothetical protein
VLRDERAHHDRLWLAWHTAALTRAAKLPALADLMRPARPPAAQTLSNLRALAASLPKVDKHGNRRRP